MTKIEQELTEETEKETDAGISVLPFNSCWRGRMSGMHSYELESLRERAFCEEWRSTRKKGRPGFIWKMAILWGFCFGGFWIAKGIYEGHHIGPINSVFLLLAGAGGYFVGIKTWDANEKRFIEADKFVKPTAQKPDGEPE